MGAWLGHWGLFALFVCFECLPVVVKILMSSESASGPDGRRRRRAGLVGGLRQGDREPGTRATEQAENDQLAWQGVAMEAARAKAEAELRVSLADLARWEGSRYPAGCLRPGPGRSGCSRVREPMCLAVPGPGRRPAHLRVAPPRARPAEDRGLRAAGAGPGPAGDLRGRSAPATAVPARPPPTGTPPTGTPPPGTADANGSVTYPGSGPGSSRPGTAGA